MLSTVPWAASFHDFLREAKETPDAACCFFLVDEGIPEHARSGYATLVIAYTRQMEPVTIFEDGSALLLIKEGGVNAAQVASERIMAQLTKLRLEQTLRVAITLIGSDVELAIKKAREKCAAAAPASIVQV